MARYAREKKREERVTEALRTLYEQHGYRKYRMGRFEAYELYLENINFLPSRHIITFNDLDGRVLALKPDVTLSIVKNTHADRASSEKFYYLENVYRLDKRSKSYREISQLGLEYLGVPDAYQAGEVVTLAARTLSEIAEDCRMQLSHVGFVQSLLDGLGVEPLSRVKLADAIRRKNAHELEAAASGKRLPPAAAAMLNQLLKLSGPFEATLARAQDIAITPGMTEALNELKRVYAILSAAGLTDRVTLDFSLLGDMDYYCGVAFQGYAPGVPRAVLSGGCYAGLLRKLGRDIDAIGFAVYLSELMYLAEPKSAHDVDVLLRYGDGDAPEDVARAAAGLMATGLSVRCERSVPDGLNAARVMTLQEARAAGEGGEGGC